MAGKNFSKLIYILFWLFLFTLLAEITLRLTINSNKYYLWRPNWKVTFKPYPGIMPGVSSSEAVFKANSDGVRGDELTPKHSFKVLAVGGSTTECLYIDQKKTWPHILQDNLAAIYKEGIWVGNIGRSGLSTTGNLIELKYLLPQYQKIDLIIALVGFNDFQSSLMDTFSRNNLKPEKEKIEMVFVITPSKIGNFEVIKITQRLLNKFFRDKGIIEDSSGSWYIGARNSRKRAQIINSLPDLSLSLEIFEDNINQIIDLAGQSSARIIFLTQPYMWNDGLSPAEKDLLWFGYTGDKEKYYSIPALIEGLKAFNLRLKEVCKKRKVGYIDLEKLIAPNTASFYDDLHFNEEGCRKVAGLITEYLRENKIPEP